MSNQNPESPNDEIVIDIQYYVHVLVSSWKLIFASALALALAALIFSMLSTPIYRSTTTLYVDAGKSLESATLVDIRASESLARTYAEMLKSRPILETTAIEVGKEGGLASIPSVSVSPVPNTQLMRIQVQHNDKVHAAEFANKLVQVFIAEIRDIQTSDYASSESNYLAQLDYLEGQIGSAEGSLRNIEDSTTVIDVAERNRIEGLLTDYNREYNSLLKSYEDVRLASIRASSIVRQIEEAQPTDNQVTPNTRLNTILGLMIGLVGAGVVVFAREFLDDSVRNPEDLSRQFGVPILGQVLNFDAENEKMVAATQPRSPAAEAFRSIRLNLKYASVGAETGLNSILVTSASPSEGKSTVASNLSAALAQGQQDVVLIDGDLRRPRVHKNLSLPNRDGFSNLFIESLDALPQMLQETGVPRLSALVSGPLPPNPSELLDTTKARQIIQATIDHSDIVVVDAPPIVAMTDAVALSQFVDGVVLVVRAGSTRKSSVQTTIQRLKHVNANLLGFVITDIDNVFERGSYYYYRYYQDYHKAYTSYLSDEDDGTGSGDRKSKRSRSEGKSPTRVEGSLGKIMSLFKL